MEAGGRALFPRAGGRRSQLARLRRLAAGEEHGAGEAAEAEAMREQQVLEHLHKRVPV